MADQDAIPFKTIPFNGGINEVLQKSSLPLGAFSQIQNMRPIGNIEKREFEQRKGHIKKHTIDGGDTQEVISLYQFRKEGAETHFYRQLADGSIEEATDGPPTVTTGVFGSEVLAARTNPAPASWSSLNDLMLMSDGAGQHVIYSGQTTKVNAFIVYKGNDMPDIPEGGENATDDVTDDKTTTYADISSLDTLANNDSLFVRCPVRANKITLAVGSANSTVSALTLHYRKNDGTWADASATDGTKTGGNTTIGQSGDITWTLPTDEVPHYMFGQSGFWYRISVSVQLDASVTLTAVSCEGPFQEIQNVWDGIFVIPGKTTIFDNSQSKYSFYDSLAVDLGRLEGKNSDIIDNAAAVDKGGGEVGIPITGHKFLTGDSVTFATTTNYNDTYTINSYTANEVVITETYNAEVFAGTETAKKTNIDYVYFVVPDPIFATYLDPQNTPNVTAGTIVGTDIAFKDNGDNTDYLIRTSADVLTQGFEIGMDMTVAGSASNDGTYTITQVTTNRIYVQTGSFADESASASITISRSDATTLDLMETWTGSDYATVGAVDDGSNGIANAGFVTWGRTVVPRITTFRGVQGYWYRFSFDKSLSSSIIAKLYALPYYDIDNNFYKTGQASVSAKNRGFYSFNDNIVEISARYKPMVLNGADWGSVPCGDGKKHKPLCMKKFYNEVIVWGEEKGADDVGGYTTLIQGDSPFDFKPLNLSNRIGILNAKCAVVLEDVNISALNPERPIGVAAFWLSRKGPHFTAGGTPTNVAGGIANYFDETKDECIRHGYADKHFMEWDSTYKVIRIGLVSGGSATKPNKFFLIDLNNFTWYEDVLGQKLSCITETEAASGDITTLQYGGGQDGFVYQLNTTEYDVSTDIVSNAVMEINGQGKELIMREEAVILKAQTSGSITRTVAINENTSYGLDESLSMVAETQNDAYRRHRFNSGGIKGHHLSIKWENDTSGVPMHLLARGFDIDGIDSQI